MVGLLKIEGLDANANSGELRRYFKDNGARPDGVHVKKDLKNDYDAIAFLVFSEKREHSVGLQADGTLFRDRRLRVQDSSPKEFNRFFM